MKRLMIPSIVIGCILLIAIATQWHSSQQPPVSVKDSYFTDIQPYLTKQQKIPHALRRPNEWFYRQRAYPYDDISAEKPLRTERRPPIREAYHIP